jgi:hypothetical protein
VVHPDEEEFLKETGCDTILKILFRLGKPIRTGDFIHLHRSSLYKVDLLLSTGYIKADEDIFGVQYLTLSHNLRYRPKICTKRGVMMVSITLQK